MHKMKSAMVDKLGTVVIGRNEGERLRRCLESLIQSCDCVVYVDSGSTDNSVAMVSSMGVDVVELDCRSPLNAARARHEGFKRIFDLYPELEFVFFVDGDCEVADDWIKLAIEELKKSAEVAVVCGRRRERYPDLSVYNRICDLEWDTPIGEVLSCGGDAVMRVEAYNQAGGFDPTVSAGEEPEFCHRLRKAGWTILRVGVDMTWHDVAITKLSQWCRRAMRTGYGGLDVQYRFGLRDFSRINTSARIWAFGWPLAILSFWAIGFLLGGSSTAFKFGAFIFMLLPIQVMRVAWKGRCQGLCLTDALAYGVLIMLSKWPQTIGQLKRIREGKLHGNASLIEYKTLPAEDSGWLKDLERYPVRPWLKEQSIWAIAVHRFGRRIDQLPPGLKKQVATLFYWRIFRLAETVTGISLPKEANIGPGLRIHHFGNIFIHPDVQLGANCTLRQGVTIGNRIPDGPVPIVGDNVEFGAYAQVFGGVVIGEGAKIGAMSVVLNDVPPNATAVGIPARIVVRDGPVSVNK